MCEEPLKLSRGRGPRDYLEVLLLDIFGKSIPIRNFKKRVIGNLSSKSKWAWQAHFLGPQPWNFGKLDHLSILAPYFLYH